MKDRAPRDLSRLPSMTALLAAAGNHPALRDWPRAAWADLLREALDSLRQDMLDDKYAPPVDVHAEVFARATRLHQSRQAVRLVRVINATGIVLHTGLGRSVLATAAIGRIADAAVGACNLEIDLESGRRGQRGRYAEKLLCQLTGAEAALIVNNNAAAMLLVLHALARDREVIVSRGQLIEIGGSFRLPEVMTAGGATLREVGTTNKTRMADYENAIHENTALLLHVHTSNYRVMGFVETPGPTELVDLARRHNLLLVDDLGSGAILDDALWQEAGEPTVVQSLRHGADVVAFSGDKLLGGPQSGILLGRSGVLDRLRRDPMARALRIDKLTTAALEATLELYLDPDRARAEIPTLARLSESIERLTARAQDLANRLRRALPREIWSVAQDESFAGGGALPVWPMPTAVVRWRPVARPSVDRLTRTLRLSRPAVLPRIREGHIIFDLRTIAEEDIAPLIEAVVRALSD